MKKFVCTFLKVKAIKTPGDLPQEVLEQTILTDQDGITVVTPAGYMLLNIKEILPDLKQFKSKDNAKLSSSSN